MTCFKCGIGQLATAVVQVEGERCGEQFSIRMTGFKCPECGFETLDSAQTAEFSRKLSDAYRTAHGLLTSGQIRLAREALGMTQEQFARHVGVGPASVKRWEIGKVQDRASDQLMRLRIDPLAAQQNAEAVQHFAGAGLLSTILEYGNQGSEGFSGSTSVEGVNEFFAPEDLAA